MNKKNAKSWEIYLLLFAMFFPFCYTFMYFVALANFDPVWQKGVFSGSKIIQFSIPIVWIAVVLREKWLIRRFSRRGVIEGVAFGLLVFVAMLCLYQFYLKLPGGALAPDSAAVMEIKAKVKAFNIESPWIFLIFGSFYVVFHSGLEEYYWRWFVFGKLKSWLQYNSKNTVAIITIAIVASSAGFMLHHIILLCKYFGYANPLAWIGSLGVGIGGAYWAWSYNRFDSIWPAWISHGMIDAAIFIIGYLIIFK